MKKMISILLAMTIFLLPLTGCGSADPASSLAAGRQADTDAPKTIQTKARNPQDLSELQIYDPYSAEYNPFDYQNKHFQIKETTLYCKENDTSREIPLIDQPEDKAHGKSYALDDPAFLLSGYLFYSYYEFIPEKFENGASYEYGEYGESWLYRMNLETEQIDAHYILTENLEKEEFSPSIWGADPDSGYIYLNKAGNIHVLDLSLKEIDMAEFLSSKCILDIYWAEEGYVLTDTGIYRMNLALDEQEQLESPELICTWQDNEYMYGNLEVYGNMEVIGIYGRFLYGRSYYFGTRGAIAGHYFQVDLDGKNCQILSADQKKSFSGNYDAEHNFDTTAFTGKHELYSEGRDNADESWDPIRIRYILSEDGSVNIETEKIEENEMSDNTND